MTACFNEDSSSGKCQLNSMMQGASGGQKREEVKPVEVNE